MDNRRKRLLFRATHRGTKESDALIGGFISRVVADLSDDQVTEAENLLEESDLDLLIDPTPKTSLLDIGAIRHELRELLGVKVDVLTPRSLPDRTRDAIIAGAIPV